MAASFRSDRTHHMDPRHLPLNPSSEAAPGRAPQWSTTLQTLDLPEVAVQENWDTAPDGNTSHPPVTTTNGEAGQLPRGQLTEHWMRGIEPQPNLNGYSMQEPMERGGASGLPEAIDDMARSVAIEAVNPCVLPQHHAIPGSSDLQDSLSYRVGLRIVRTWMATTGDSCALQDVPQARKQLYADLGLDINSCGRHAVARSLQDVYGVSPDCLVSVRDGRPASLEGPPRPASSRFGAPTPSTTAPSPRASALAADDDFGKDFDQACSPAEAPSPADTLATLAQLQSLRIEWQLLQKREAECLQALQLPAQIPQDPPDHIPVPTLRRQVLLLAEKVKQLTKAASQHVPSPSGTVPLHQPPLVPSHFFPPHIQPAMPFAPPPPLMQPSMLLGQAPPPPLPSVASLGSSTAEPTPPPIPLVPRAASIPNPPQSRAAAVSPADLNLLTRGPALHNNGLRYLADPAPSFPDASSTHRATVNVHTDCRSLGSPDGAPPRGVAAPPNRKPPPSYTEALQDRLSPPRHSYAKAGQPTGDAWADARSSGSESSDGTASSSSASSSTSQYTSSISRSPSRQRTPRPSSHDRRQSSGSRRSEGSTRSTLSAAPPLPIAKADEEPMKPFTRHLLPRPVVIEDDRLPVEEPHGKRARRRSSSPASPQFPTLLGSWYSVASPTPPDGFPIPPLPFPLPDPFDARLPPHVEAVLQQIALHDSRKASRLLAPPYGGREANKASFADVPLPDPLSNLPSEQPKERDGAKEVGRKRTRRARSSGSSRRAEVGGTTKPPELADTAVVSGLTEAFTTSMLQRAIATSGVAYLRVSRPSATSAEVALADAAAYKELFRKFDGRVLEGHELLVDRATGSSPQPEMEVQEEVLLSDLPVELQRPPSPPLWHPLAKRRRPSTEPRLSPFAPRDQARTVSSPHRHSPRSEMHSDPLRRHEDDDPRGTERQQQHDNDRARDRRRHHDEERARHRERDWERGREEGREEGDRRRHEGEAPETRRPQWTTVRRRPEGSNGDRRRRS